VKAVLSDIAHTNSCHVLFRWAWLNFKILNLDERSLYLRLKEKIEKKKYKLQKEEKLKKKKRKKR